MQDSRFACYAFSIVATLAISAGCSANGSTPSTASSSSAAWIPNHGKVGFATFDQLTAMTNVMHKGVPSEQHPLTHSWMRKPPKGTTGTIWATDVEYGTVDMIAYPSGTLMGQVSGFSFPQSDCSDSSGNVYVGDAGTGYGYEIQAGTTNVINSWFTDGYTMGCSVSRSGDVSFTDFYTYFSPYGGGVWVFPGGGATGTFYAGPGGDDWAAGYDPSGNLYVACDYGAPCSTPRIAELPAGGNTWIFLNFNGRLTFPGAIQNMGKYLGITDQEYGGQFYSAIGLAKVSGSDVTVVKVILLEGGSTCSSSYEDLSGSWGSVSKKPDGVVTKRVTRVIGSNLWCFPSPLNVWKAKGGDPVAYFDPVSSEYDYGVTFTKP